MRKKKGLSSRAKARLDKEARKLAPLYDVTEDPPFDIGEQVAHRPMQTHRVTVLKDHALEYPALYLDVFIASDNRFENAQFAQLFSRARCTKADTPDEADLVIFTGGEDVDPALYGRTAHPKTKYNTGRDSEEIDLFLHCKTNGIPMFGVCRGAQFLHVMHGGQLYQDVDGHYGDHSMRDLKGFLTIDRVSSVHHQMVKSNIKNGMEIIAVSRKSQNRYLDEVEMEMGSIADIEAFFYRETCSFGVQGHPEYQDYNQFAIWTLEKINQLVLENPDIDLIKHPGEKSSRRRIKPDLLEQRQTFGPVSHKELN